MQQRIFSLSPLIPTHAAAQEITLKTTRRLPASIPYSWWTETRVYSCRLSVNRAPPGKAFQCTPLHWRQHAGRNRSLDDMEEGGFFVPGEVILAADPNPQNKEIHHPVWFAGSQTKTDTAPRRLSGTRRQSVCSPCFALFFACSARLCCCAVDVRLRKEREERAENVTYSAGRARRRRRRGGAKRSAARQSSGLLGFLDGYSQRLIKTQLSRLDKGGEF